MFILLRSVWDLDQLLEIYLRLLLRRNFYSIYHCRTTKMLLLIIALKITVHKYLFVLQKELYVHGHRTEYRYRKSLVCPVFWTQRTDIAKKIVKVSLGGLGVSRCKDMNKMFLPRSAKRFKSHQVGFECPTTSECPHHSTCSHRITKQHWQVPATSQKIWVKNNH